MLAGIITDATCGEACWEAREDICRCSCGGRNHAVLRSNNGVRPERTSKISGRVFKLIAVGTYSEIGRALREAQDGVRATEPKRFDRLSNYEHWDDLANASWGNSRFWERKASESAIRAWPELTAARQWQGPLYREFQERPMYTLWERC